jgi:hypothetical protein
MKTLIIYDNTGFILSQMQGAVREPVGINYIYIDIPKNKNVIGVDVTNEVHVPIYEDLPKDLITLLEERQLETEIDVDYRLSLLELGL